MECTQTTAALIGSIILLVPNVALLVYADGSQRNCSASDTGCMDIKIEQNNKDIRTPNEKNKNSKSEASDKYGLVPPFLGAASAVIIIYIVIHCLYLHCYAKKKMKRMAQHNALHSQTPATIVMTDHPSSASMQPMTPIVKYEGAYGKTEVLHPQSYFIRSSSSQSQCQSQSSAQKDLSPGGTTTGGETRQLFQTPPSPKPVEIIKSGAKRTSSLLSSIKSRSSKKSSSRMSTSSIGTDISIGLNEHEVLLKAQRSSLDHGVAPAVRTNVCFVPLGNTVNEIQANESSEWIPVQGYIYNPKGQENGNLNSSLNSLQNCASQIVFIPMTLAPKTSTVGNSQEQDNPVAMNTGVSSGNQGNTEMEVFPEESESKEDEENESLLKEEEVVCEADSPSDTEVQPETENITVEVHNNPTLMGT